MEATRRVALITGASSGIGFAIARRLSRTYVLAITSLHIDRIRAAASELQSQPNCNAVLAYGMDVRNSATVSATMRNIVDELGRIDVVINSAGIGGGGITCDFPESDWNEIISTNLTGTFLVTTAALRESGMLSRRWGRIVNIASTGGKQGVMHAAAYSASKHGVVGFTKALGLELAKSGITVNAVCPGFVETPLAQHVRTNYANLWGCTITEARSRIEQRVPLGRYVEPEEVAGMVEYLLTEAADPIVGQAINVCGGLGNY